MTNPSVAARECVYRPKYDHCFTRNFSMKQYLSEYLRINPNQRWSCRGFYDSMDIILSLDSEILLRNKNIKYLIIATSQYKELINMN